MSLKMKMRIMIMLMKAVLDMTVNDTNMLVIDDDDAI
jgi:hypothetical protein